GLRIGKGEPEGVVSARASAASFVRVVAEMTVPTDQAAQVAAAVVAVDSGRVDLAARAYQLAVQGEMRSLQWGAFPPDYVLPASIGEEAVVAAGDQLCPVLENDL